MPNAERTWNPKDPAVWKETVPATAQVIMLRHPAYPFRGQWAMANTDGLRVIAARYLRRVSTVFGLPKNLFVPKSWKFRRAALPSGFPLTWLPIGLDDNLPGPRASFWIRHSGALPRDPVLRDRTAIMFAVQAGTANDEQTALGSRLGIRIVMHVSPSGKVRITGSTCSAELAHASEPQAEDALSLLDQFFSSSERRAMVKDEIAKAAGLESSERVWLDGLRVRSGGRRSGKKSSFVEAFAYVERSADKPLESGYAFTAQRLFIDGVPADKSQYRILETFPLIAHATPVTARLFPRDPASQAGPGHLIEGRPNRAPDYRSDYNLERFRSLTTLPGLTLDGALDAHLEDDLDQAEVMRSRLVDPGADESKEQVVHRPDTVLHARTNAFAALSGYQHARELFDTMRFYGLDPATYFRFATLPLHVRYRAPITPGPGKDGKTVNAMVDYEPATRDYNDEWDQNAFKYLKVCFALADLKRSLSRREPLGLAADPRWSWHEYAHVLLAASSSALELNFVHSVGDGLSAILWDPQSALEGDPPAGPQSLRMATFPWVYLNRRHDRSVYAGWSWSGTYHRAYAFDPAPSPHRRKGYNSEQILSTSLFRIYQALGGDTVTGTGAGLLTRWAAADYTAYLIMRALAWTGPISAAPPTTPDELVLALTDADVGTATWQVPQRDPAWPLRERIGGCAFKVVRWAFEAQGLYAGTTDPLEIVDAPGLPQPIDIFIENGRPDSEGAFPRGGYMPVSLDWNPPPNGSKWLATADALQVVGKKKVFVKVRNRGQSPATGVVVQVWYIKWPSTQPDPPAWDPTVWKKLGAKGPKTVPAGGEVNFGPFTPLPTTPTGDRLLIFAEATCPGDRATSDAATGLPCSTQPTPIVDLVAGDNNLGLRLYTIT